MANNHSAATIQEAQEWERDIYHEAIEHWSVDDLQDYCRKQGYKCSGSKNELISRVCVLHNSRSSTRAAANT